MDMLAKLKYFVHIFVFFYYCNFFNSKKLTFGVTLSHFYYFKHKITNIKFNYKIKLRGEREKKF